MLNKRADEQRDTDGEIVWSRHPGADVKFARDERMDDGGKKAGPQGERV
ncbi:hypothetical protein [Bradyrhizobium sp. STM 3557]